MDDYHLIQNLKQMVAQDLPIAYVDFNYLDNQSIGQFNPLISAFMPARFHFNPDKYYRIRTNWIPSGSFTSVNSQLNGALSSLNASTNDYRLVPSYQPTIL